MPLQIPHPTTPLHLFRHLLREASYLPSICRPWVTARISSRFRACRRDEKPAAHIKEAHAALRYLRSANTGHLRRLERLCYMATGRVGRRKRLLSQSLFRSPPSDADELDKSRNESSPDVASPDKTPAATKPKHASWLDNWSLDKVGVLARSQFNQQQKHWPGQMRRTLDPARRTKGENCFGEPYGPKRIQKQLKKHWSAVLGKLLPPLPQGEWDHLAALATGDRNVPELQIATRRPVAKLISNDTTVQEEKPSWDWTQHVTTPARVLERGSSRKMKTLTGEEDQDPRGHGRAIGAFVMSPRKLQRLYGRLWEMSPTVQSDASGKKLTVTWGEKEVKASPATKRDLIFFDNVSATSASKRK